MLIRMKDFPDGSVVKDLPTNEGDSGSLRGSRRSQEKEMAIHSRILTWEIPRTEESDSLQSMELQKSWRQLND